MDSIVIHGGNRLNGQIEVSGAKNSAIKLMAASILTDQPLRLTNMPRLADTRFLSFDASDRATQALTRGVTLEVERGWFGATSVKNLSASTSRGSARFERGGPDQVRRVLPQGAFAVDVRARLAAALD